MYIAVIVEDEVKLILAKLQDAPDRKAVTMHDVMESWPRENIIPSWKLVGFGSDGECVVVLVSTLTLQWKCFNTSWDTTRECQRISSKFYLIL